MTETSSESKQSVLEERELKFPCASLEDLREQLREMDAERLAAANSEDNWIYDHKNELKDSQSLLRLRIDRKGARLTYKGAPRFEDEVKVREEQETQVDDADQMHSILENLGFRVVHRYQKKREEWHVGGVTVALDHTPIGDFVEFEGTGAGSVARRFGFELDQSERRSYVELYESYRQENPDAPPDMVFP
jgi:predicted adenylyl cyclase CyaB